VPTHLPGVLFRWFSGSPRGWAVTDKDKKSECRTIAGCMKLFLEQIVCVGLSLPMIGREAILLSDLIGESILNDP
jgi:hypothetical protein